MLTDILSESPVFRGLEPSEIENILNENDYKIKKYEKGDIIAIREDRIEHLMIMIKGSAKGEMLDVSGKTIKIEDIITPYPLASAFIFGQRNQFPVDVTANEYCEVFMLPKKTMLNILQNNNTFLINYLNAISNRSQFLAHKLMFLNFNTIKKKLSNYILKLAAPDKETVNFPKSQEEMASYFGITRPSFARSLKELEKDGAIKVKRREISILNKQLLISNLR